jgi:hypothetical protein
VPCPREIRVPIGGIAYGYLLLRLLLLRGGRTNHRAERKAKHRPTDRGIQSDIHRMAALTRVNLQLFKDFGNANSSTRGLPCTHAGDIGAPSAGNAGLVVIQTHLSLGF